METKKDFKPILIWLVFIFLVPSIILSIFIGINSNQEAEYIFDRYLGTALLISNFSMFIILALMYYKKVITDFKRLTKKHYKFIFIATFILLIINITISVIFYLLNITVGNQERVEALFANYTFTITISAVIIAPFVEELAFRESIGSLIKNDKLFILISALSFGIVHSLGIPIILYGIMGAAWAIIYLKTDRNLSAAILAHFINNAIAITLLFLS